MIRKGDNFIHLKYADNYMSAQSLQKTKMCPRICFFSRKPCIYAAQSNLVYEDFHCHTQIGGDKWGSRVKFALSNIV